MPRPIKTSRFILVRLRIDEEFADQASQEAARAEVFLSLPIPLQTACLPEGGSIGFRIELLLLLRLLSPGQISAAPGEATATTSYGLRVTQASAPGVVLTQ